jgi:hypothetical protein
MPVRFTQNNLDLNQNDYLYQICPCLEILTALSFFDFFKIMSDFIFSNTE